MGNYYSASAFKDLSLRKYLFRTSAGYLVPATVCSEPLSSLAPQWKWNCFSL